MKKAAAMKKAAPAKVVAVKKGPAKQLTMKKGPAKQPAVKKPAAKASKSTARKRLTNKDVRQIEAAPRVLQKLREKTDVLVLIHNPGGPNRYEVNPSRPGLPQPEYWALGVPEVLEADGTQMMDLGRRIDKTPAGHYYRDAQPKTPYGTVGNYDVLLPKPN